MADISKITASNGTTYDIKDATARLELGNKLDTSSESWRPIACNGGGYLGYPVRQYNDSDLFTLEEGTNITLTPTTGKITIAATDTKPSEWMAYEWTDNLLSGAIGGHTCTLQKGLWLVYLFAFFSSNSNGYRYLGLSKAGDNTGYTYRYCTSQPAINGSQTCITMVALVNVTATSEAWLTRCHHNAGTNVTLSVINGYKAIKLM